MSCRTRNGTDLKMFIKQSVLIESTFTVAVFRLHSQVPIAVCNLTPEALRRPVRLRLGQGERGWCGENPAALFHRPEKEYCNPAALLKTAARVPFLGRVRVSLASFRSCSCCGRWTPQSGSLAWHVSIRVPILRACIGPTLSLIHI